MPPQTAQLQKATHKLLAFSENHDLKGVDQNQYVEEQTVVFDVVQVVLKFLDRIFNRCAVLVPNLCQTGDAWLDAVAGIVKRHILA